jgi:ABC-type transport system involved in multi-copper enzyme maturation permease subunit
LVGALVLLVRFATFNDPPYSDYIDGTSYNPINHTFTVYRPQDPHGALTLAVHADVPDTDPAHTLVTLGSDTKDGIEQLSGHLSVRTEVYKNAAGLPIAWSEIHAYETPRLITAGQARQFLLGATVVELAVILLIVTNAAASTREKEDGTLDLLLSTPITSRYYIWGKLRGLVSFVLPLIAVPVLSVLIFVIYDVFRQFHNWDDPTFQWIVFPEAVLILPAMLIIVSAFAAILGMNMSLRCRTTVMAVMLSVGIVIGLCGALGWCGYQLLQSQGGSTIGVVAGSFSPFTLMTMLIDPYNYAARAFGLDAASDTTPAGARILAFVFSFIAVGAYTAIVWSMYKSMVKNFDMTIRKQSR